LGISRNTVRRYLRSETIEPAYAERRSTRAIDKYAFQLSALLKTEAAKSRKQRRTLKQIHEDLKELGFEGSYDRVAAFARTWREGQTERVNPASKRTPPLHRTTTDEGFRGNSARTAHKTGLRMYAQPPPIRPFQKSPFSAIFREHHLYELSTTSTINALAHKEPRCGERII
jgi:hypothetical protein